MPAENDSTFPQFEGKDLDGNSVDSSLFANNAFTVVNFWFSGCKPCVDEMDDLDALNQRIKEQGGEVIGVNTETLDGNADNIATAKKILESAGASFRNIYFDPDSEAGKFALGIMAFPTTYVVDRQGNIVGEPIMGGIDQEANMTALEKLIADAVASNTGKEQPPHDKKKKIKMPEKQKMARNLKKLKDNIVTITDDSQNEFEKF